MKYFIISLFLISFVGFIIPQAFSAGENFFYGITTFERLPTTIIPNNPAKFEIKFHYTAGSYALKNLSPIIEVSPEGARSKVHFDVEPVSAYQNDIVRIPVTITVEPDIEYEKIFLSISYAGIGFRDVPFKSSWSDSIIFNIDHDVVNESNPFPSKQIKSEIIDKIQCKETTLGVKYGKPINLQYDIDGGTIASICKIDDTNSVVTKIDAKLDGQITITIPKKIIYSLSSTNCDEDSDLIILMDNEEALPASTIHNKKDNVITVEFSKGIHTIEFIGTTIMPDPSPAQYCGIVMGLDSQYLPPKFQMERGMKAEQIRCNEGLFLVIKATNGSPACVKQETGKKLLERNWTKCTGSTIEGRGHPCGPHSSGVLSFEPPRETYLSKTVGEWKNMSLQEVENFYGQYKEEFDFTELGRFLIKDEMQKELQGLGIENKHNDFRVFSGMVLTSGPPHISFHAVVNATDGNRYLLEGGTFANTIEALRINQLAFYSEVLNPPKIGSGRTPPAWGLLHMEPKVIISPQEGNAPIVEPYSLILDLEKSNTVTFYNNLTIPIRIQEEGTGFVKDEDNLIWKSTIIPPKQSGTVQFNATGNYQWDARSPPNASEEWWGYQGAGQIAVFSNETKNLPFEEKIAIARAFLDNARPDIPWTGMGSSDDGIDIMLNDAIFYMIPDAEKYYKARAQQWVPFEVPIIIVVPEFPIAERFD